MTTTTIIDQTAVPLTNSGAAELLIQATDITGGKLYTSILRQPGVQGQPDALAQSFVPSAAGGRARFLALTSAKSDLGVALTAAAGTPAGSLGVARTAGTSLKLNGEATANNAKTDKAIFEFDLPDSYIAGADIALTVNCNYDGAGNVTAGSTTLTPTAYTEVNGVEAALTVSAAQQIPAAATDLVFTITGTSLVPGAHLVVELAVLVTSDGVNVGHVNSVSFVA